MKNYGELLNHLQQLQAQLEEVTARQRANAIADIQSKMAEYGIDMSELGATRKRKASTASTDSKGRTAKAGVMSKKSQKLPQAPQLREGRYRDPESGATWSGRGRVPRWIAGKDREQFAVTH